MESKDERFSVLINWLNEVSPLPILSVDALAGDASFRRYFRVKTQVNAYIAMDAPPPKENCASFVAIDKALNASHIHAPHIHAENIKKGFLLLEDFGDDTLLTVLNKNNSDDIYRAALTLLSQLQQLHDVPGHVLQPFDQTWMQNEWSWHKEWFLEKWLKVSYRHAEKELDAAYDLIAAECVSQPQVFMHRDFHSANLMLLKDQTIGVLDFQDAFIGPITYDLVSLLRDCYIAWPPENVHTWMRYYFDLIHLKNKSFDAFLRDADFMSVQRHLKALLTFARKAVRDCDTTYLQYIPHTLTSILVTTSRYPELTPIHQFYSEHVLTKIQKENLLCEQ